MVLAELELHRAPLGNAGRIGHRLGVLGEEQGHLLLRLEIEFPGLKAHPGGVVHRLAHLDGHEGVLHGRVLPGEVVGVVGDHQGDAGLPVEAEDALGRLPLGGDAVVLELQVVAPRPEDLLHLQGVGLGPLVVAPQEEPGHRPRQTGREGDEPLRVLPQQVHIHPRLDVKALQKGLGDQVAQIPVAHLVLAQEHQVASRRVQLVDLVKAGAGGHVDLAPDDGLDPRRLAGLVEVDHAVHHAVVGDGHRALPQVLHPLHQPPDAARAVQKAILRMDM